MQTTLIVGVCACVC